MGRFSCRLPEIKLKRTKKEAARRCCPVRDYLISDFARSIMEISNDIAKTTTTDFQDHGGFLALQRTTEEKARDKMSVVIGEKRLLSRLDR